MSMNIVKMVNYSAMTFAFLIRLIRFWIKFRDKICSGSAKRAIENWYGAFAGITSTMSWNQFDEKEVAQMKWYWSLHDVNTNLTKKIHSIFDFVTKWRKNSIRNELPISICALANISQVNLACSERMI